MQTKQLGSLVILCILAALGVVVKIWEQDIFWLLREGFNTIQTGHPSKVELWSYTRAETPYEVIYWIPSVVFSFIYQNLGLNSLIVLRSALMFVLFYNLGSFVLRKSRSEWALIFLILPLYYFCLFQKAQIRPDFLNLVLVSFFLQQEVFKGWSRSLFVAALCLFSVVFHLGYAPFAFIWSYFAFEAIKSNLKYFLPALFVGFGSVLVYHSEIVQLGEFAVGLLNGSTTSRTNNPEFGPWGIQYFDFQKWGWLGLSTLTLLALSCIGYLKTAMARGYVAVAVLFWALGFFAERAIPYVMLFNLTFIVLGAQKVFQLRKRRQAAIAIVVIALIPTHIYKHRMYWGVGINDLFYPVESVEVLKKLNIPGEIFHTAMYGNFLHYAYPEKKVFWDTREIPFLGLETQSKIAMANPDTLQKFLNHWNIDAILLPIPSIQMDQERIIWEGIYSIFDKKSWALVGFDKSAFLLVRRAVVAQDVLEKYEYKALNPTVPPNLILKLASHSQLQFQNEIERCLSAIPDSAYCTVAKAALQSFTKDVSGLKITMERLTALADLEPRYQNLAHEILDNQ